ncbi:MAG: glycosyltransferase [Isosphaeraceae bacterium]|nr:glycosyltransferase [Isosphaeraceae bacterium]
MGPLTAIAAVAAAWALTIFLRTGWAVLRSGSALWLSDQPADEPVSGWPRLAVIFPARNEAETIQQATRSMLGQDYPRLEVIAADDHSTDGTGALLDALAAADPRLHVVHVGELPRAWLGKSHAQQVASEATAAEWLLFTDAAAVFDPPALRRAVAYAEARRIDHLVVAPQYVTENEWERVFLAMSSVLFAARLPPWEVSDARTKTALGASAFNLVRAEAFRAIGGLRRLSLSVDGHLKLGKALKFAGYRPAFLLGRASVSVRWRAELGGLIRGMEKNLFAICDFRITQVLAVVAMLTGLGILPYVGLVVGPWWSRGVALVAIGVLMTTLGTVRGQNGISWYHAFVLPFGAVACLIALLRSVWCTLRRGGVCWRDRFYPLEDLRAHVRRRNAWLREVWLSTR